MAILRRYEDLRPTTYIIEWWKWWSNKDDNGKDQSHSLGKCKNRSILRLFNNLDYRGLLNSFVLLYYLIRYDTIGEINVDSKAEYTA